MKKELYFIFSVIFILSFYFLILYDKYNYNTNNHLEILPYLNNSSLSEELSDSISAPIIDCLKEDIIYEILKNNTLKHELVSYRPKNTIYIITSQDYYFYFNRFLLHQQQHFNDSSFPSICFDGTSGGFGNKIRGLISSLLLSIITDRTFVICNWPGIFEYFSFQFPVRNMNVDYKKLPNSSYYFDATQFMTKHKANCTFTNVDLLLNNQHLFIKSIYDIIPSFSSNIWFKTKYHQELNYLRITSNINTIRTMSTIIY